MPAPADQRGVLVVDGNSTVRAQAARVLRAAGHLPLEAASLAQARSLLRAPLQAVVISDQLADGTAADLLAEVRVQVPVVVLAGTPDSASAKRALAAGAREVLDRGAIADGLVAAVRRVSLPLGPSWQPPVRKNPEQPRFARLRARPAAPSRPLAEPRPPTTEAPTRPAPTSTGPEAEVVATLRDELHFLRSANHYRVLGIDPRASAADVADAFDRFAQTWNPDRLSPEASPEMRAIASEIFYLGRTAYEVLIDPVRRARYQPPRTLVPRKAPTRPPQATVPAVAPPPPPPAALAASAAEIVNRPIPLGPDLFDDIDLPPSADPDARVQQARTLLREAEPAAARLLLDELLADHPDHRAARALRHTAAALEAGAEPDACRELEQALTDDPECLEAAALLEKIEDTHLSERHARLAPILPPFAPGKRELVEAIVLAFANSEAREWVGTDALRMVLEVQYVALVRTPGTLDLAALWALLQKQPGFVAEQAIPALCRIETWSAALGRTVVLPPALAGLGAIERDRRAARCKVPEADLARALRPAPARAPVPAAEKPAGTGRIVVTAVETPVQQKSRRRAYLLSALAAAALAVSAILTLGGMGPRSVAPARISTEIPIAQARQTGEIVGLVLADTSWFAQPRVERRRQLVDALTHAQSLGAAGVVVMDPAGVVQATAVAGGPEPEVTLFK